MSSSKYRFQEIKQNFTPLSSCEFQLDDNLIIKVTEDVLNKSTPISISLLTTFCYQKNRYYLFFMREYENIQLLSPIIPDYDPNVPYLGTLTVQPSKGYPNNGGSIERTYLITDLDSLLGSFMNPSTPFQKKSPDGSINATLIMIPEGTLLDSSMNIMKNVYPDAYAAYNAIAESTAGNAASLSRNVATYTFQDLGAGLRRNISSFQFILDDSLIIPATKAILASPSLGAYYLSAVIYNKIRYFLFVLNQTSNALSPLIIDSFSEVNTFLAPEGINGYPNNNGKVVLLQRTMTEESISGGSNQQVWVATSLPYSSENPSTTYIAPIVAIPEFALVAQSYILESVYPEVAGALSTFEMINFNPNQTSPNPDSLNNSSHRFFWYRRKNSNFLLFFFGMCIGSVILFYVYKRNEKKHVEDRENIPATEIPATV